MADPTLIAEPVVEAASAAVVAVAPIATQVTPTVVQVPDVASTTLVTATGAAFTPNAFIISVYGHQVNLMSVLILMIILGIFIMFLRIQVSKKLDFADMITFDGRKVSLSKVLQLVGGLSATWVILKMAAVGTLSSELFGIYLAYVGAIEGYAKYVAAKYGYSETSVKDGGGMTDKNGDGVPDEDSSAQAILTNAAEQASQAEMAARDAKVSVKNASADLKTNGN